ncbi:putative Virulence protein SrfB [Desulfosarcina cetonica]|uniref:virulence factor SrfB n=1 Tax=Desulfosarcina cetonica TaxID=90730 RepID=UPI0009FB687A|nr:virulence factor SrfB [Desulfosarcina cetonica]VTR64390.1 putative Virulence protein SrfB [Desulfosarcina cetonica]
MLQDTIQSSFVSLIPYTGIQFLDFGLKANQIKFAKTYCARNEGPAPYFSHAHEHAESGRITDDNGQDVREDEQISISLAQIFRVYTNSWLPLPLLRIKEETKTGAILFDRGPLNWARIRITELEPSDKDGHTHRITVIVDTNFLETHPNRPYAAPSETDVTTAAQFKLASALEDYCYLQQTDWAVSIIEDAYDAYLVQRYGANRFEQAKASVPFMHPWAVYVSLIDMLNEAEILPRIQFVDTVSRPLQYTPIDVDFVLDIGNSRTCGILIESGDHDTIDLNNSYSLELRDLSQAEHIYKEPFPSVIEFHRESFGNNRLTARSRQDAFQWPTPARIGWEANRLFNTSRSTDGRTGMSSPKRYLWDTREQNHDWYFNSYGSLRKNTGRVPAIKGTFFQYLTNSGDEWNREDPDSSCVTRATYTRSAMMMFFLAEVFTQAFMQINSFGQRRKKAYKDLPRRLNRIVLTMPTAMSLSERKLFEKRARLALKTVAAVMKIPAAHVPGLVMQWDEATGTQAVFLYNEVKENFRGDAAQFFESSARPLIANKHKQMRIASIDIGGGTTDLIITSYTLEDGALIRPEENFREGFNIAGDDILQAIIERHILPVFKRYIEQAGVEESETVLTALFGASRANEDEREHLKRRLFCNQVFIPIGLRIIGLYEYYDTTHGNRAYTLTFSDVFSDDDRPKDSVIAYLQQGLSDFGVPPFDLQAMAFNIDLGLVDNTVKRTIGGTLADLCELINHYQCDYLLLSGRPSMMPGVRDSVIAKLPIPIDRIISMHDYKVGAWYPYRDLKGRLSDPKTTAAVGAMVCALSNGYLVGFSLKSNTFKPSSTAKYIGKMDDTGQIKNKHLYFRDINLETARDAGGSSAPSADVRTQLLFSGPMFIGFRQMDIERWPGTLIYRVDFNDRNHADQLQLPLKITLALIPEEDDKECKLFDIDSIEDAEGMPKPASLVKFQLQTLRNDSGYWMDTGVFVIEP